MLNNISAVASIAGFFLSVILVFIANNVNEKIKQTLVNEKEVKDFNRTRKDMKSNFESFQLLMTEDKKFNMNLSVKISNELIRLENFGTLLTKTDRKKIRKLRNEISKGNIEKIAVLLGYFINRCDKQEVFWNGR